MAQQLGSAYGVIEIGTGKAHANILGLNSAIGGLGSSMLSLNPITVGLGAAFVGLGAGIGAITGTIASGVKAADKLEVILDGVQGNMQITNEEAAMLKELVSDLGVDPNLKVSSFEAAEAIEMLGRNGLDVQEILDGAARSTVLLANATGGTFSESADIATDVMQQFGIEASDMDTAVNGITSVVNNSKIAVSDYALGIAQAGGIAATSGVSFEDFNTVLAGTAYNFASGSDAGTSFKTFLQRVIPASKKAEDEMKKLGIITKEGNNQFFDAAGNLRDMDEIARTLQVTMGDLSEKDLNEALGTIFGQDASRTAAALLELGQKGFNDLQIAMAETDAAAAAATRVDNLSGDLDILQGILETLRIEIGDSFLPIFRDMVQSFTDFVSGNADNIVGFFDGIAGAMGYLFAVVEDGDYLNDWLTHIPEAARPFFRTVGEMIAVAREKLPGMVEEWKTWGNDLMTTISDIFEREGLSGLASAFWDWMFGDEGTISGGVDGIIDSITGYLSTKWPALQGLLQGYADQFWTWLLGDGQDEGALQRFNAVLQDLMGKVEAWVNSPETQQRLTSLGEALGNALAGGLEFVLTNAEEIERVLTSLVVTLGIASGKLIANFKEIGAMIAQGVMVGMVESFTGEEISGLQVDTFNNALLAGAKLALPGGAGVTGGDIFDFFSGDTTPPPEFSTQDTSRQTELLEELTGKIKGQSNILIDEEALREAGFIVVEDVQ